MADLKQKAELGFLMRELQAAKGWEQLADLLESRLESEKNQMARGITDRDAYFTAVGRVQMLNIVLHRPERLVDEGLKAERVLLGQSERGD